MPSRVPGEHREVHLHTVGQRRHEPPHAHAVLGRKAQVEAETIVETFEKDPLGRVGLAGNQDGLDRVDSIPADLIVGELALELPEELQALRPVDQIRVGNGVRRSGKEIGQANLIPDRSWHDDQRRVEEAGDLLEEVAQQPTLQQRRMG